MNADGGAIITQRFNLDPATEHENVALDHIHANATTGHISDFSGGRKTRLKDQIPDLTVRHAV